MNIPAPPPFKVAVVPTFTRRLRYRSGRGVAVDLRKLGFADDRVLAYIAACDVLAKTGGQVILDFGWIGISAALQKHRSGLLLFARADLLLCPVPRDYIVDSYAPGAQHRIGKMRAAVIERAALTGSPALEWTPLGDIYRLAKSR